jgi:hypothetical protein
MSSEELYLKKVNYQNNLGTERVVKNYSSCKTFCRSVREALIYTIFCQFVQSNNYKP